jgi:hypothetical protein
MFTTKEIQRKGIDNRKRGQLRKKSQHYRRGDGKANRRDIKYMDNGLEERYSGRDGDTWRNRGKERKGSGMKGGGGED